MMFEAPHTPVTGPWIGSGIPAAPEVMDRQEAALTPQLVFADTQMEPVKGPAGKVAEPVRPVPVTVAPGMVVDQL